MRPMSEEQKHHRTIRSYVLREGRLTTGQQHAFATLWPKWGIDFDPSHPLVPQQIFGNDNPVVMEIGFGNGESLAHYARHHPQTNYLGVEVHGPGVGHLLIRIDELGLINLRLLKHDAIEVLHVMPDACLQGIMLFFPDPWHKKRHHKRRILKPEFVSELARVIRPGGFFHAATDWENYSEQMMEVLSASPDFSNSAGAGKFSARPDERPLTKFEQRGQRLGHGVWDLVFIRKHA
jgi:tRNA (guanine-N7-)-methyltransferase